MFYLLMLQMPGVRVRDIDGVEPGSQRGINIGAGRIANHPTLLPINLEILNNMPIGGNIFLRYHNYLAKILLNPRSLDLELLLLIIALRQQNQGMARREIVERRFYSM